MSDNPQDQQTAGPTVPDEPGEIGWPADASEPGDPSIPEAGSGTPGFPVVPEPVAPTVLEDTSEPEAVEPDPVPELVVEPVADPEPVSAHGQPTAE